MADKLAVRKLVTSMRQALAKQWAEKVRAAHAQADATARRCTALMLEVVPLRKAAKTGEHAKDIVQKQAIEIKDLQAKVAELEKRADARKYRVVR